MTSVAIVDYGMGNLDSVRRAAEECGAVRVLVTSSPADLRQGTHIILPGVGAFPDGMAMLRKSGMDEAIREQVLCAKVPFLGICLGMQLMATRGFEGRECQGLDLVPGEVHRFIGGEQHERIPHIGWNEVEVTMDSPLFEAVPSRSDFYFVHSYHMHCEDSHVIARTPYCGGFVSAVMSGMAFGVQFHPEKSQKLGFRILRNFLAL